MPIDVTWTWEDIDGVEDPLIIHRTLPAEGCNLFGGFLEVTTLCGDTTFSFEVGFVGSGTLFLNVYADEVLIYTQTGLYACDPFSAELASKEATLCSINGTASATRCWGRTSWLRERNR